MFYLKEPIEIPNAFVKSGKIEEALMECGLVNGELVGVRPADIEKFLNKISDKFMWFKLRTHLLVELEERETVATMKSRRCPWVS